MKSSLRIAAPQTAERCALCGKRQQADLIEQVGHNSVSRRRRGAAGSSRDRPWWGITRRLRGDPHRRIRRWIFDLRVVQVLSHGFDYFGFRSVCGAGGEPMGSAATTPESAPVQVFGGVRAGRGWVLMASRDEWPDANRAQGSTARRGRRRSGLIRLAVALQVPDRHAAQLWGLAACKSTYLQVALRWSEVVRWACAAVRDACEDARSRSKSCFEMPSRGSSYPASAWPLCVNRRENRIGWCFPFPRRACLSGS